MGRSLQIGLLASCPRIGVRGRLACRALEEGYLPWLKGKLLLYYLVDLNRLSGFHGTPPVLVVGMLQTDGYYEWNVRYPSQGARILAGFRVRGSGKFRCRISNMFTTALDSKSLQE